MNIERKRSLKKLQLILNYQFKNIELLNTALCHSSYAYEYPLYQSNERLEFLGDAVLGIVISNFFFQKFPLANEGQLSKARSNIVNETQLAAIARKFNLNNYLLLGRGEEVQNGRNKASILANTMEAVIAAIFLDGGLNVVENLLKTNINFSLIKIHKIDYKTRLQEQIQKLLHLTPCYQIVSSDGPEHKKKFRVIVKINNQSIAEGNGYSRKEAEQKAAKQGLSVWHNLILLKNFLIY